MLIVATLASEEPERQWEAYRDAFGRLGVSGIQHLRIDGREQAAEAKYLEMIGRASVVFFTGGDQLKISSKLGGSPLFAEIKRMYEEGRGVIAGTSAGASAMGATMLVSHVYECFGKNSVADTLPIRSASSRPFRWIDVRSREQTSRSRNSHANKRRRVDCRQSLRVP